MTAFILVGLFAASGLAQAPPVSEIVLATPTGEIAGTLVMPPAPGKVPVVLIIAGSGPTDRDGNSAALPGKNDAYRMLAEALAADGIASVRFDKRGIAASRAAGPREIDLRFETYVDDAVAWIARLRADMRFSRIVVAGHSEGSLIGMLAAKKAPADAFVSIAGVAQRASDGMRGQLRPQIGAVAAVWEANETILKSLESGMTMASLPPDIQAVPPLAALYRPSVQPYMISWFRYVPSDEFASLRMPALIVQGTTDIQVGVEEAKALAAAQPAAQLAIVDGMNHVLKRAPADRAQNIAAYSDPSLPIVTDATRAMVTFIRALR